jgi:hypothetical protein
VVSGLIATSSWVVPVLALPSLLLVVQSSFLEALVVASVALRFRFRLQIASFVRWRRECSVRGTAWNPSAWRSDLCGSAHWFVTSVPCGATAGCSRSSGAIFDPGSTSGARRRAMGVELIECLGTRAAADAMDLESNWRCCVLLRPAKRNLATL